MKICTGDWKRVVTRGALSHNYSAQLAVFLDPPYSYEERYDNLYRHDTKDLRNEIVEWCIKHDQNIKIALCGYEGEYNLLEERGWIKYSWTAGPSFRTSKPSRNDENRFLERIWFSPLCIRKKSSPAQLNLID